MQTVAKYSKALNGLMNKNNELQYSQVKTDCSISDHIAMMDLSKWMHSFNQDQDANSVSYFTANCPPFSN